MKPAIKTLLFVAVACFSTIAAFATHRSFQVDLTKKISDEGEEFFPAFSDPNAATSLQVAAYDANTARVNDFKVEFKDGKWRIPSHNNYPADGKDRLRETAASVVGVRREAQVGESADDHRRYNLLDPLSETVSGADGRGTRITIKNGDEVLVDYIVGKKVENVGQDVYYIRKADEPRYYRANLGKFNISTKFAEWIEPDLLQIERSQVEEISVNRYKIDLTTGEQTEPDVSDLSRKDAGADWTMAGLDESKDKVKASVVNEMLQSLDDLKIVGVRRKPELVASLLRGEKPKATQTQMFEVQLDMQSKGFVLQKGIIPVSGSITVGTFEGISYDLSFGSVFSGTDVEIEVGQSGGDAKKPADEAPKTDAAKGEEKKDGEKATDAPKAEGDDKEPADKKKADQDGEEKKDDDSKLTKSRYVFIQVRFDEKLLGDKPKPPVKPEPPAKPEAAKDAAAADAAKEADKADTEKKDEEKKDDAPKTDAPDAKKPDAAADEAQKKYEVALKEYELNNEVYETQKKGYEKKIADGKKRAAQLNGRFADWYYVVAEDVYEGLRSRRADLIEPKDAPQTGAAGGAPMIPSIPGLDGLPLPGGIKPMAPAKEEGDAPADGKPAAEAKAPEKAPEKGEAKPEAGKPAEPAPPAGDADKGDKPAADAEKPAAETKPEPEPEPKADEKPATAADEPK
ncbi:DUF4340 domain-containing protein [Planctomyces sp. SH-PL14]|uniref:DUF4340 domain-containing protein n=1 Tax=Planctomyces sp. SH-PL14 TaxID=1632864 RepID=UPI00078ED71F|nr:DUF4340 domain-containing protein [Planctomyces sp. SH-PL14]AMV16661.1 hypothetical protein VT03_02150 [Planctomyces sp. SH-PL14]